MSKSERYLAIYSGALTAVFAVVLLTGAAAERKASFEEIDVQRINVREPDGTLRMVVSSMARFPDAIEMDGESMPHVRENAGMLFFNDEGIENGGLVFAGKRGADGQVHGFVHLSMDQYKQDQVIALNQVESGDGRRAGLTVFDRPDRSTLELHRLVETRKTELSEDQHARWMREAMARGEFGAERLYLGKTRGREAVLRLNDASNRARIQLRVAADGEAAIEFLDEQGKVAGRVTPESLARIPRD
jgi:hypothetical protein